MSRKVTQWDWGATSTAGMILENTQRSPISYSPDKTGGTISMDSTYLAMFLARQSFREISPMPGKWFSRW